MALVARVGIWALASFSLDVTSSQLVLYQLLDTFMYIYWYSIDTLVNPYVSICITTDTHRYT